MLQPDQKMLIPKETPYLEELHGFFLKPDKLVEHMQTEIGSGCIYSRSPAQEHLLYFSEFEVIRCIVQQRGKSTHLLDYPDGFAKSFCASPGQVSVFYLDLNAVYFWEQIPPFTKSPWMETESTSLAQYVTEQVQNRFSGFMDVFLTPSRDGGVLFFKNGQLQGGSYSWGQGGLSPWEQDYETLLSRSTAERWSVQVGTFSYFKETTS